MRPRRQLKSPRGPILRSVLFRTQVVDSTVGMFVGAIGTAMLMYRGGTWWDKLRQGHSFWENFLCDLLHHKSLNGASNLVASRIAGAAMLVLIVGLVAAFSLAPEVIPSRKHLGRTIAWLGSIGAVSLAMTPLLPSDAHPVMHQYAVVFGGLPALGALALLVGAMLLEPVVGRWLRACSLLLLVLVVLSLSLYAWAAFLQGPSLRVLPGLERLANLLLLAWLLMLARLVRGRLVAYAVRVSGLPARGARD